MICEHPKCDIVDTYQAARRRLKLGRYERYLVEHIAARVERLLQKRDAGKRVGDIPGDVHAAERESVVVGHRAQARTRE